MSKSRYKKTPATGSIASRVRHLFDPAVRGRGLSYFEAGAVRILRSAATSVRASVQGTRRYMVEMDWGGKEFLGQCLCPYFEDTGPCKHLWATLLAVEARDAGAGEGVPEMVGARVLEVEDDEDDDFEEDYALPAPPPPPPASSRWQPPPRTKPTWKELLDGLHQSWQTARHQQSQPWPSQDELLYVIDVAGTLRGPQLILETCTRRRTKDGQWGIPKPISLSAERIAALPTEQDRRVAALLLGATENHGYYYGGRSSSSFGLHHALRDLILPELCRTGRCQLRGLGPQSLTPLSLDEGPAWQFRLDVRRDDMGDHYLLRGSLRRDEQRVDLARPTMLVAGGWVFWPETVARLDDMGAFNWIALLRRDREIQIPVRQGPQLVEKLLQFPVYGRLDLPAELAYETLVFQPQPCLTISRDDRGPANRPLTADLSFRYGETSVPEGAQGSGVFETGRKRLILRDGPAEQAAQERLRDLRIVGRASPDRRLTAARLPAVVRTLVAEGWRVEAQGNLYRNVTGLRMAVASGIDWFELRGGADFGEAFIAMPELLTALRKGQKIVLLDDGSYGLLPEEWLERYGLLARIAPAEDEDGKIRFSRAQTGLLDALLAERGQGVFDDAFAAAREQLHQFEAVQAAEPPPGFAGELRGYQKEGLGWLEFLRQFGFGGCLADDMGLGKTVQVLALLEGRRQLRAAAAEGGQSMGPSLAVVPRSVLFNWRQEAQRFCPALRVLEHCGADRTKDGAAHFAGYDLVLTTYGTLRRDITVLKDVAFDYVILDESQTIKNAGTAAAKAVRLLKAPHRLCLSGTPIENHLGELWSQFEFLNPGMLGVSRALSAGAAGEPGEEHSRALLARALRPFILRRTKAQVAKDLPDRTEQTIHCQLDTEQRRLYDELREHYRASLLQAVDRGGIGRAKIQILEALLRLRQAACHPGLIDKAKLSHPSAKLEALLPQIQEVLEEGHKALVFSQFTSLLAIVRSRLDDLAIPYEYLDGRTRDRQARVERFQNDPKCGLFLISLKAGGLGLNLTAAEYVFLLDPWWNPAVEAQAIDRAHRIGQTRQVFAYRLIAADTVEQHVLKLQQTKRALADAIINADNSLIRDLGREDLELLLS